MERKLQIQGLRFGFWRVAKHAQAFAHIGVAVDVHSDPMFFTWTENVDSAAERAIKAAKPAELKVEEMSGYQYKMPYGDPDIAVALHDFIEELGGKASANIAHLTVLVRRDTSFEIGFAIEVTRPKSKAAVRRRFRVVYKGALKRWAVNHKATGKFRQAFGHDPVP